MNGKIRDITITALGAALLCVLSPLSIPVGPVPVSLATLAVYFILYVLGMKRSVVAIVVYLLIGLAGVPVFSGFSAGPAKLAGPTGGYLLGYIPMAFIAGFLIDRYYKNRVISAVGMTAATAVLYAIGTVWLAYAAHMEAYAAIQAGVIPFVPFDLVKIALAAAVGPVLRIRLEKTGLLSPAVSAEKAQV